MNDLICCPQPDDARDLSVCPSQSKVPLISVTWIDEALPAENFTQLGIALASLGWLYRRAGTNGGLLLVYEDGETKTIEKANQLSPIIADHIALQRFHNGKQRASRLESGVANDMLQSEFFLSCFKELDRASCVPAYLPGFVLPKPGYNDGGEGHRCFYVGDPVVPASDCRRMNTFLDVMDFDSEADRANAVAGLLTVMLRHNWPGAKPIIIATASKSHSGKDTVLDFCAGQTATTSVTWGKTDWANENAINAAMRKNGTIGVIRLENARVPAGQLMCSAFVERFVTDACPTLYAPGLRLDPLKIRNDYVMMISTNDARLDEDLLNRSMSIYLKPKGGIGQRQYPIGNPRHEYLPKHRDEIALEAHGLIARWKKEGMPLHCDHSHPCTAWSKTIGGILMVNGIEGFLANYADHKVADDPVRSSIALLGANISSEWLPANAVLGEVINLGLLEALVPSSADRASNEGRLRGLGKTLSKFANEEFVGETDDERVTFRLEKARRRFGGSAPEQRYRFEKISRVPFGIDAEEEGQTNLVAG